jgi:serine/threonine-protein kinase
MIESTIHPGGPDRDLLFAGLALKLGFVDADLLQATLKDWKLDRSQGLTGLLVERHALIPRRVPLLDGLTGEYMAEHANDAALALANLQSTLGLPFDLGGYAAPRAELATVASSPSTIPGPAVPDLPSSEPMSQPCRFRIIRPHARGALGQVFVAVDQELKREVALKEMQDPYASNAESRARFMTEAEITGQLEHPGIVPVYGLGYHADGRPYYAMRFIRGESLHEAITRYHAGRGGKQGTVERSLALRRLLGQFIAVCNAIAYAHSRGVIHRDIKPSNVMLGPYGETLVVDWGLAKASGQPVTQDSVEMPIAPVSHRSGIATMLGVAVGTPAFMPPEQASGRMNEVGPRSDIYSLGATLYHLLTGELPFTGETVTEIVARVKAGSFLPPRKVNREVPPPLEAVVLKAMAHDPADRYASAHELAQEVERWMADEPVRAHAEPVWAKAMRWMRRNRPLVAGVGALLLTALVGLAAGLYAVGMEQARTRHELNRAEANLELARKAVDECFILATRDPLLQAEKMRPVRRLLLEKALPFYEGFQVHNSNDPALAQEMAVNLFRVAHILSEQGNKRAALSAYVQARDIFQQLASRPGATQEAQSWLARVWHNLGKIHHDLQDRSSARSAYAEALSLRRSLARDSTSDPEAQLDLAQTHNNLGALDQEVQDLNGARAHLEEARRLALPFAADHPEALRALGAMSHNLGLLLDAMGDQAAAMAAYQEARHYRQKVASLGARHARPLADLATTLTHIAELLVRQDRNAEATATYRQAGEILQDALTDELPDYLADIATVDDQVGTLLAGNKLPDEARLAYDRALAIRARLVKEHPNVERYRYDLAGTRINLAHVLRDGKAPREALELYGAALPLLLQGFDPSQQQPREDDNPAARPLRRMLHAGRAEALGKLGRHGEAARDWDAARWQADDPDDRNDFLAQAAASRAHIGDFDWCRQALDSLEKKSPSMSTYYLMACSCAAACEAAAKPQAEEWARRAVDYLRCAWASGYFDNPANVAHARETDEDLRPLRGRKEFEELLSRLPGPKED